MAEDCTGSSRGKIYLSPPDVGENELNSIIAAYKSNWIAPLGPEVDALEDDLEAYVEVESAAALSSGTSAIHLALILLGIAAGDRVYCSTFTFAASAFPICYLKAIPVFIGSESSSWNMCPSFLSEALERDARLGKLPKAVIVADLYGMPADYQRISAICERYNIYLIEDAAEGLGSTFMGKKLGSFGKCSILSFNGNKIITTSGGGALLSNDSEFIRRARVLAAQARDPAVHYEHSQIGYNYRLSNLLAALGRAQLKKLSAKVEARRSIHASYREQFKDYPQVKFLDEPSGCYSNRWLTTITFEKAACNTHLKVMKILSDKNIESRPLWKPLHLQPVFKDCEYRGDDLSEVLFSNGICIPSGSSLSKLDIVEVSDTIKKALD